MRCVFGEDALYGRPGSRDRQRGKIGKGVTEPSGKFAKYSSVAAYRKGRNRLICSRQQIYGIN